MQIFALIFRLATTLIRLAEFLMLVRAIFSWIPVPQGLSGIYRAVYALTEPLIAPFRAIMNRFSFAQRCPLDLSFLLAVVALEFLNGLFYFVFAVIL